MREHSADILKERNEKGYYCSLLGRYLINSEMTFRESATVSRDIFHFILNEIKSNRTTVNNKIQHTTTNINSSILSCKVLACRAEVEVWMTLTQDPAVPAQCRCATRMRVTFKKHSSSKLHLGLARAVSRSSIHHCVVVKNPG